MCWVAYFGVQMRAAMKEAQQREEQARQLTEETLADMKALRAEVAHLEVRYRVLLRTLSSAARSVCMRSMA